MATPKLLLLAVTVASTLVATTPAMADVKSKDVHYGDLDLSSEAGRERLQLRIKYAVRQVCGSPRGITIRERLDQRLCEKESLERARPQSARTIATYMEKRRRTLDRTASVATK